MYQKRIIELAYKLGYDPMEEIKKYTTLEIKYSQHNKFKVSKEAQERACRETLDNMLIRYKSKR